jgi:hypothetical protein
VHTEAGSEPVQVLRPTKPYPRLRVLFRKHPIREPRNEPRNTRPGTAAIAVPQASSCGTVRETCMPIRFSPVSRGRQVGRSLTHARSARFYSCKLRVNDLRPAGLWGH